MGINTLYPTLTKAQDTGAVYNAKVLQQYVEIYYLDFGSYPEDLEELITAGYFIELPLNPHTAKPDFAYDPQTGRISLP